MRKTQKLYFSFCKIALFVSAIINDIDKKEMLLWTLLTMQCDFPQMTIAEANSIISNLE